MLKILQNCSSFAINKAYKFKTNRQTKIPFLYSNKIYNPPAQRDLSNIKNYADRNIGSRVKCGHTVKYTNMYTNEMYNPLR